MCEGSVTHGPEYWSSATAVLDLLFALWAYAASGQRHWNPLVRILYPLLALNAIGSIGYHSTNSNFFGKIDLWSQMIITMIGAPVALDEVVRTLILPNSGFEPVPLLPIQNAVVPDSNSEIVTVSQPTIVPESSFYGISKSVWIEGGSRMP
ncbi:hypothetical protein R1flu_024178 [Riccia fluitans]|uniref:Uncharacterized protein n=1 Tax=Riccia fluitans TaxID=41844 RepID=A0ABD1XU60_9MARC